MAIERMMALTADLLARYAYKPPIVFFSIEPKILLKVMSFF